MKSLFALSLIASLGAVAPATATPLSGIQNAAPAAEPAVEKAAYRRCWWHHGHRHCRWVATRYYDYGYYDDYPGYYGYGPSVGLYFGGGGWGGHRGGWHGGHGGHRH